DQSPATSSSRPAAAGVDSSRNRECVAGQSTDCLPLPGGDKPVRLKEGLGYFAPGDTSVGIGPSKAIRTQRNSFIRNQGRMVYAQLLAMKLPIGSGAIESAVRRVMNLRLKGPSLFWCRASAEAILLLRSSYKAGRWQMLKQMATSPRALLEA